MTRSRKVHAQGSMLRTLLSEVLPYELPASFSNSGLYLFLLACKSKVVAGDLYVRDGAPEVKVILRIIFGNECNLKPIEHDNENYFRIPRKTLLSPTAPYSFNIRQSTSNTRSLSIPHPATQIAVAAFYDTYRSLILLHTTKSNFSIRHPSRIARYTIYRDNLFGSIKDRSKYGVESSEQESLMLRSYFAYERYSNIHRFHESAEYRLNEKKFGHLLKLDIQKCFDSIYTHSVQWAVHTKQSVKDAIQQHNGTFSGIFDELMRAMNDAETHGIVIGPEVSRIFAEIILQRVDVEIENRLNAAGLVSGRDYRIMRYVDDYFIFMRDTGLHQSIAPAIEDALRPYRFHLNLSKETINTTPFISDLSIGKAALSELIEKGIRASNDADPATLSASRSLTLDKLIRGYKTILRERDLDPVAIANYTLSEIERSLEEAILATRVRADMSGQTEETPYIDPRLSDTLAKVIELSFYVYGGSPRVAPAIKLVRTVALVRKSVRDFRMGVDIIESIDDLIFRESMAQLERNPLSERFSVEGLYLLALISDLPLFYTVSDNDLCRFMGIVRTTKSYTIPGWYGPQAIFELLRFTCSRPGEFTSLVEAIEGWLVSRVDALCGSKTRSAEEVLLVLDAITCPILKPEVKWRLLRHYGLKSRAEVQGVVGLAERWFTSWGELDLHHRLQMKRSQEVY